MLSILIPSCDRPAKLERFLRFADLCLQHDALQTLWSSISVHIMVAASPKVAAYSPVIAHAKDLGFDVQVGPVGLPERLRLLGARITHEHAMLLGDDDLPVVESIFAASKALQADWVVVGTRFANIRGIRTRFPRLDLDFSERPYWGVDISDPEPRVRVAQELLVNAFGVSSLAYGVFRSQYLQGFLSRMPRLDYYSSIEVALNSFAAAKGSVHYRQDVGILRDFTYMDYVKDPEREAPEGSAVPYIGEGDLGRIAEFLQAEEPGLDAVESLLRSSMRRNVQFDESLGRVRSALEHSSQSYDDEIRDLPSVRIAGRVWKETYKAVYARRTRYRRRLGRLRNRIDRLGWLS